jgi:glycosyltransferase involved in cell wall biosynthesis
MTMTDSARSVLFLTHVGDPGGAEYKMVDLCRALGAAGRVLLFQHGALEAILRRTHIPFSVAPMSVSARSVRKEGGLRSILKAIPGTLAMLRRVAREGRKHDVVVCFSQKSFVVASLAKPFTRRPVVWFMNDILSPEHFSRYLVGMLVWLSRWSADHVVLNSYASRQAWLDSGGRTRNVSVIYPGAEAYLAADRRRDAHRTSGYRKQYSPNGRPLIGMFGRISRWKGQEVFLKAIAQLPEVNAVIVGGALFDEEAYERRIRDLTRELGIESRVVFTGHISDVMALMAACNVIAHCSTAPEPFGLVIVQAMLAGVPVIASDAGGAREIVTPGETGQLTPLQDHAALARAIRRYLDDPQWSHGVAQQARVRACETFTSEAMTKGFFRMIESL